MVRYAVWTADEVVKVVRLVREGLELEVIAQRLQRSPFAVSKKIHDMKLRVKGDSLATVRELREQEQRMNLLAQKIMEVEQKLDLEGEFIQRLLKLRTQMAKLCLRYPALASELGVATDGLPMMLRKKEVVDELPRADENKGV